ncbi:hypothetical protein L1887_56838 [Cichorium endivia]|nr:hypothetical protein L1887_56838 [Cichorium endivia]
MIGFLRKTGRKDSESAPSMTEDGKSLGSDYNEKDHSGMSISSSNPAAKDENWIDARDGYRVMASHLWKSCSKRNFFSENPEVASGVAIRFAKGQYVVCPAQDERLAHFCRSVAILNCEAAMTITSPVVSAINTRLAPGTMQIPITPSQHVQVVDTMEQLAGARKAQNACFIRRENTGRHLVRQRRANRRAGSRPRAEDDHVHLEELLLQQHQQHHRFGHFGKHRSDSDSFAASNPFSGTGSPDDLSRPSSFHDEEKGRPGEARSLYYRGKARQLSSTAYDRPGHRPRCGSLLLLRLQALPILAPGRQLVSDGPGRGRPSDVPGRHVLQLQHHQRHFPNSGPGASASPKLSLLLGQSAKEDHWPASPHHHPDAGHCSGVMLVSDSYFEAGMSFFTRLVNFLISFMVAAGDVAPFMGHNAFLRWSAIQEVAFVDPEDGISKIWSEAHVSEDFDMALRLIQSGYITRWATYSNNKFEEGVSLTCDDELNRWQKYAFGCAELVFNRIWEWPYRGPFTKLFRSFLWGSAPMHYKFSACSYIFSYYAIACGFPLCLGLYLAHGWFYPVLLPAYMPSFNIWVSVVLVFTCAGNVAQIIGRYRAKADTLFNLIKEHLVWIPFMFIFFGGPVVPHPDGAARASPGHQHDVERNGQGFGRQQLFHRGADHLQEVLEGAPALLCYARRHRGSASAQRAAAAVADPRVLHLLASSAHCVATRSLPHRTQPCSAQVLLLDAKSFLAGFWLAVFSPFSAPSRAQPLFSSALDIPSFSSCHRISFTLFSCHWDLFSWLFCPSASVQAKCCRHGEEP